MLASDSIWASKIHRKLIMSEPTGAWVLVDGDTFGTTPVYVDSMTSGFHYILVKKDHFYSGHASNRLYGTSENRTPEKTIDTLNFALKQFAGTWWMPKVPKNIPILIKGDPNIGYIVTDRKGKQTKATVGSLPFFWNNIGSDVFPPFKNTSLDREEAIYRSDCVGIKFALEVVGATREYYLFLSKDGEHLLGRSFTPKRIKNNTGFNIQLFRGLESDQ